MEKVTANAQAKSCKIIAVFMAVFFVIPNLTWAGRFKVVRVYDGDTLNRPGFDGDSIV